MSSSSSDVANNENDKQVDKNPDTKSSDAASSSAASPTSAQRRGRSPLLFIAAAILAGLLVLFGRQNHSRRLSESYALCSRSGNIYTVDETKPRVECLVVDGSRIRDTGSLDAMRKRWGDREKTGPVSRALSSARNGLKFYFVDDGHIVVPGLADAHAHILEYGFKRQLELDGAGSVSEVLGRVKNYILSHPDILNDTSAWVQGMGWDQTRWPTGEFPTAADLDSDPLLNGRPISLRRVDGHALWVSSRALELIEDIPEEVDGGIILRDHTGKPTGVFLDNAMLLVPIPPWSEAQMLGYFKATAKEAVAHGLTSIHDADSSPAAIAFYKKLAEQNKLPFRIYAMGYVEFEEYWGSQIPRLIDYGHAGRLNVRSVKMFSDGALGSWGAALLEPYSDKLDSQGILRLSRKPLTKLVRAFWKDDFQVNIHCIGDRANKLVLDVFEELLKGDNVTQRRPRIEHAQIMHPDDLKRISRLGVTPSVQPTHATSDMWYAETRLGPKRIHGAYAYRTLLESSQKQILPLGSDFPVEGVNPLAGFYAATSRLSADGDSPHGKGGWYPEQKLTRTQALKGMTLDAAYAAFAEDRIGSLTPGKQADFVILDNDIMSVPYDRILKTRVVTTVIDGRPIYGHL